MNNRGDNMGGFNAGMGMFNNLMGSFADTMRNVGGSARDNTQNLGESLGNWGQRMGEWGQSMTGLLGGGNIGGNANTNQSRGNRQSNRQPNDPTQDPNFNPFDHVNFEGNRNAQNFFSNGNGNSGFNYHEQQQATFGPFDNARQQDTRHSHRQQQHNYEQRQRNRDADSNSEQSRSNRRVRVPAVEPDKILFNEAKAHIRVCEIDAAIEKLVRAMELNNSKKYSQMLAFCYLKKGDFNLAIALFKEMLSVDPNNSKLHRHIGICYMEKAKLASSMALINDGVDHFYTAYEVTNSELNYRNYLNAKKLRFLALAEAEHMRKTKVTESLRKYNIPLVENCLRKTYLEKHVNMPEHFKCAITLVS